MLKSIKNLKSRGELQSPRSSLIHFGVDVSLVVVKVEELEKQSYPPEEFSSVPVGRHCILELYGCPIGLLNDIGFIREALQAAAKTAKSTLLKEISYQFEPYGVTALALLAESHISIHTWPENGYIAVDVFTCGQHTHPEKACEYLVKAFQANNHVMMTLPRGKLSPTIEPTIKQLEQTLLVNT